MLLIVDDWRSRQIRDTSLTDVTSCVKLSQYMVRFESYYNWNDNQANMVAEYEVVHVNTEGQLFEVSEKLSCSSAIAFDCEGVDLGRHGPLTVATFGTLDNNSPIYVVDVQVLGGDKVFSESNAFKELLEGETPKIMFDCRADSDALFHQFGVKLNGVLDMQIMDQATRIYLRGEAVPQRCEYLSPTFIPRLPNMDAVAKRSGLSITKLPCPHSFGSSVWSKRPLDPTAIAYAAQDVHVIREIQTAQHSSVTKALLTSANNLWPKLEAAVREHSQRYEGMYRDMPKPLNRSHLTKDFITEEISLVDASELPNDHPNSAPERQSKGKEKWDAVMSELRLNNPPSTSLFNNVLFVLQHNDWYTDEGIEIVRDLALACTHLTFNQKNRIRNPPKLSSGYDSDDYWAGYDSDGLPWPW